jgi:hypothetical protein
MSDVKFRAIGVGTTGISYKWDVPLTIKEYSELKKSITRIFSKWMLVHIYQRLLQRKICSEHYLLF